MSDSLKRTPLHALHLELGARMVPFAGYDMPVQYKAGLMAEHLHTRTKAGLFDVSHMGQLRLSPRDGDMRKAALALESLMPMDIASLSANRQRYALLTNEEAGILDDLMIANMGHDFFIVVNAACKERDADHIAANTGASCDLTRQFDRALLALQGPEAQNVLKPLCPAAAEMRFMDVMETELAGLRVTLSRSGYTGEDGYEIGLAAADAETLARKLLADPLVLPVGLGARDSLRLEAGLCLYGHDLDPRTTVAEASLLWAVQKSRRPGGARAGGYPGAARLEQQMREGTERRRVGIVPEGRAPVREGAKLYADSDGKTEIGVVTSGAFGPTVQKPVAMGYVLSRFATSGAGLFAELRGKFVPVHIRDMPFVAPGFKR